MSISNSQVSINMLSVQDRQKVMDAVKKIDDSLTRIIAERDLVKATIDDVVEAIPAIDKKTVRKIAKTFHKASFTMDKEENEAFEEIYTTLYPTTV